MHRILPIFILTIFIFMSPGLVLAHEGHDHSQEQENTESTKTHDVDSLNPCTFESKIIQSITYSPVRAAFNCAGYDVTWNSKTKTVTVIRGNDHLELKAGEKLVFIDDGATINTATMIVVNGISYIPESFIKTYLERTSGEINKLASVDRVLSSVVMIATYDESGEALESGSGFILSRDGVVITSHHVIERASSVEVVLYDSTVLQAEITNSDVDNDLAYLTVTGQKDLLPVTIAVSSDLVAGQEVFVISSPFGLLNSVSTGIISSPSRTVGDENLIQLSAAVYYGSSGAPVFNLKGEVIGIISGGSTNASNINFAVHSDKVDKEFLLDK